MRKKMVAGNWKMHGSRQTVDSLVKGVLDKINPDTDVHVIVCPPFIYMERVAHLIEGSCIKLGAQTMSRYDSGAYTGDISWSMLQDVGCEYVIVGHCERRMLYGETDYSVAKRFKTARKVGLTPILCVGETLDQRDAGMTDIVVGRQIEAVLEQMGVEGFDDAIISYEPVWAIGTGKSITPEDGQHVHAVVREKLAMLDEDIADKLPILYGGSVKPHNALSLFGQRDIDGGLIGGAALDADSFVSIIQSAEQV